MAFQAYLVTPAVATSLRERFAGLHRLVEHKYWVDEFYDAVVVRPFVGISEWLWRVWDARVIDGIVNGVGSTLEGGSAILKLFQTGYVGTYALFITLGVIALFLHFMR
jgi:NADH-quinone oxidoreductase subunit L